MSQSFVKSSARERITQVVESWFLTEPLLFAAWTMHDVVERPGLATIRVGRGKIEFNPDFIRSLRRDQLRSVLGFEAMRILLGHPYARQQPKAELSYQASNLTVQECLRTKLPIPRPRDLWGDERFDNQYFEFYYRELAERASDDEPPKDDPEDPAAPDSSGADPSNREPSDDGGDPPEGDDSETSDSETNDSDESDGRSNPADDAASTLDAYSDPDRVGMENTTQWDNDDLKRDEINAAVREAAESDGWGTVGGQAKEQLLATLHPKLDYRGVLRNFRQSVLSVRRRLTRMKPSRRYGFAQMGSRYDFTTKLLFAVDVSGSMGHRDLQLGFSVVSHFFRYGVESVDVIWFDEDIRCEPLTLRHARSAFEVSGRGGTNFGPVIDYIDRHRDYDGLIIFTDGYAPVPPRPQNTRTRVLWLFKDEATHQQMHQGLRPLGRSAFLKESPR
ncbi:VWA-like domain-containing protein [Stieleria sp. ICT_E10.1]|uniref:DUF2201 family putative metallopeptidase n=1 Tax=Stieleria sedimenti TaxID=2976331 RepID=UPI00217F5376|nr:VWA-like domain-containing protein [Stieleria sedimenti]MCS7471569.1 VWA-like domain-containing protein [Stieleria sedimenti]